MQQAQKNVHLLKYRTKWTDFASRSKLKAGKVTAEKRQSGKNGKIMKKMMLSQMEEHAVIVLGETVLKGLAGGIDLMEEDKEAEIFEDILDNEGTSNCGNENNGVSQGVIDDSSGGSVDNDDKEDEREDATQ